jgi:hypothetical protein
MDSRKVEQAMSNTYKQASAWDAPDEAEVETEPVTVTQQPSPQSGVYLMWFDDSHREVATKIADAVADYTRRFGAAPNVAVVNAELPTESIPGIVVRRRGDIQPAIIWVGVEA